MSDQIVAQEELKRESISILDRARALVVDGDQAAQEAGAILKAVREMRKKVAEVFDPVIERAHQAHKAAVAAKRSVDDPLAGCEQTIKTKLAAWQAEEERKRREEEARLRELIRQQEEERLLAAALEAEAMGDAELAAAIIEEPVAPPVVTVAKPAPPSGVSFREDWSAEVVDLMALIRHVAQTPSLVNLLAPNQTALNAMARAQKSALSLPGVRAVSRKTVVGR